MNYMVYLDEFGHVGPFVSRDRSNNKYWHSPVFGFAGFIMPMDKIRYISTWFFKRKQELFYKEIDVHPAFWEKKGNQLYSPQNFEEHPKNVKQITFRLFNEIKTLGGFVFYVGIEKHTSVQEHKSDNLYVAVLLEAIKRLDEFCEKNSSGRDVSNFLLAIDEHRNRSRILTKSAIAMYGPSSRRHLLEQPMHLESHRYQNIQIADWIGGLVGRIGAFRAQPTVYQDYSVFQKFFEGELNSVSIRSGIRFGKTTKIAPNS